MPEKEKIILGIETSCDDTSICLLKGFPGTPIQKPEVLSMHIFSQDDILKKWGGVVPEIAARNHLEKLTSLLKQSFEETNLHPSQVNAIGVTTHPGLLGPLLTGLNGAKTLSLLYQTPLISVNHLYAHIEAIHLTEKLDYPYLGLIVSGGHTLFLLVQSPLEFEVVGTTLDDAAGEAFDKGGKLMGLNYPAGREIDLLALEGNKDCYDFPISLKSPSNPNFSFSGLKTSLRLWLEKNGLPQKNSQTLRDLCASYQEAIVQALKLKSIHALKITQKKKNQSLPLVIGGGVACNGRLRKVFKELDSQVLFVPPQFCTDNGGMIAHYALRIFEEKTLSFPQTLWLDARSRFIQKEKYKSQKKKNSK